MNDHHEWLEADGLGGFASGTESGVRTRRYHALLLTATTPPTGRMVLVNGVDVLVKSPGGSYPLFAQRYAPDVRTAGARIESFESDPWPRWTCVLPDGTRIVHEVVVPKGESRCVLTWKLLEAREGVTLSVRPLLSGRDFHAIHRENGGFRFEGKPAPGSVEWRPYADVPGTLATHNGEFRADPAWYRQFEYDQERERGLDFIEDLASPGRFEFDLSKSTAELTLSACPVQGEPTTPRSAGRLMAQEQRRRANFETRPERAGDAYIVSRGEGKTIVAGYPWFADWGRDTFISIRGLCLATGRLDDAKGMLLEWSRAVCMGMLPNRFADQGEKPEYNSVDAALWFVIAAAELCRACKRAGRPLEPSEADQLRAAVDDILTNYAAGTAYGIGADDDGLLRAGVPGVQLTWMDAKVGSWVVTPRHGKPVEIQALWINALKLASAFGAKWRELAARAQRSFREKFWNEQLGCLYDVIDVPGSTAPDASIRPNQIFAVGGLPYNLLRADRAKAVVDAVERTLLTPLGLRSLAPGSQGYCPRYAGDVPTRDGAYHQGTVWPWLMGAFVEAWIRVRRETPEARREARSRFLDPLMQHLNTAGLGHVSEIADAEAPHRPAGCPFQAWSVGELIRLDRVVLAESERNGELPQPRTRRGMTAVMA